MVEEAVKVVEESPAAITVPGSRYLPGRPLATFALSPTIQCKVALMHRCTLSILTSLSPAKLHQAGFLSSQDVKQMKPMQLAAGSLL